MDLGIVCQKASTGGVRYAVMLASAIRRVAPQVSVTFHHGPSALTPRGIDELRAADVQLSVLDRLPPPATEAVRRSRRYLGVKSADAAINSFRQATRLRRHQRLRDDLGRLFDRHDVVHFAWPYEFDPPPVRVPYTFIPHDFIYSHEFGIGQFNSRVWEAARSGLERWVAGGRPIVSSDFIASEYRRVFPDAPHPVEVIYLSSLHVFPPGDPPPGRAEATRKRFGLPENYILCPNNVMPHKNLAVVISALWHLRQQGEDIRLVVIGPDTEEIRARVNGPLYGDRVGPDDDWDVRGLGLVGDDELLDLMRGAVAVINPSLCEAGTGSGLDAWGCGCPVVLSDIPAFRDQVRYLGTRASFFDPRDPKDAARAILAMMRDPAGRAADAAASRAAMDRYDWDAVARQYVAIFESVAQARPGDVA